MGGKQKTEKSTTAENNLLLKKKQRLHNTLPNAFQNIIIFFIIIISSTMNKRWNKQTNVGNNGIQSWGSREWHKSFWDQANLSLKRIMEQVVLLLGNKG